MSIPRDTSPDSTLALLREGYEFIPNRVGRSGSDLFETRLLLRRAVCLTGVEAARAFYVPDRLTRRRAMPPTALTLLQDKGSALLLDGAAHRHRKQLFLDLLAPGRFDGLLELARAEWAAAALRWQHRDAVVLHQAAQEVLCRAVSTWAGVPLEESDVRRRTDELAAMIEGAGSFGPRNWRGQVLRGRSERWLRGLVDDARAGRVDLREETPAHAITWHRNVNGQLLDTAAAAVELLNILRPTVAVAHYITFAAVALHEHPETVERLRTGGAAEHEQFVQEIRRMTPFFPLVAGRVLEPFDWKGYEFPTGRWVLLDIYGTNRDPRAWARPDEFRPERFRDWDGDPYTLIPQGGGDHALTHRCPGEWVTIALTKVAVEFLTSGISYEVPPQDLRVDHSRMPALPNSGFLIQRVRLRERGAEAST